MALEDVPGLINPIIHAMIATATLQKQGAQQEIEKEKNKEEAAARKEQLKQALEVIKNTHEHMTKEDEARALHAKAALISAGANAASTAQNLWRQGNPDPRRAMGEALTPFIQHALQGSPESRDPNLFSGQGQPQGMAEYPSQNPDQQTPVINPQSGQPFVQPDQPTEQMPPTAIYGDRNTLGQVEAEAERLKTEAQLKTKKPYEIEQEARAFKNASEFEDLKNLHAMGLEKERSRSRESVANINGAWRLKAAMLSKRAGETADEETLNQLHEGIFNGTTDFSKLPMDVKKAEIAYAGRMGEAGSIPLNGAKYKESLDNLASIQPIMEMLKDLAQNYSSDSPNKFKKGNLRVDLGDLGTYGFTAPGKELKSKQDSLSGLAGRFAQFFDFWKGRKSNQEIMRQILGVFDPASTMKENWQKVLDHEKVIKNDIRASMPKMAPERIDKIMDEIGVNSLGAFGPLKESDYTNVHDTAKGKIGLRGGKWHLIKSGEEIK